MSDHVQVAYDKYQKFGWKGVLPEYENGSKGGGKYLNSNNILPLQTKAGADIKYREFDVNSISNTRDRERFIVGSDGSIYYTSDHYRTFVKIKGE